MALLVALVFTAASPARAHKDHKKQEAAAQQVGRPDSSGAATTAAAAPNTEAGHDQMGGMMQGMDMEIAVNSAAGKKAIGKCWAPQ